ncbi:MAG: hypothetical protein JNJ78_17870 [Anaerolineae bacterium]|nr:hypothetical protein [Anaerolineae bacterium]
MSHSSAYPCPNCQIGLCQPGITTYVCLFNGMLVSVPDMPVWCCDICQHQEFDHETINNLEALLGIRDTTLEPQRSPFKITAIDTPETTTVRRIKP